MSEKKADREKMTLADELARQSGKTVYIGARSSFFFIGPADEAASDLLTVCAMLRRIASMRSANSSAASRPPSRAPSKKRGKICADDADRLGKRRVLSVYDHDIGSGIPGNPGRSGGSGGVVIIIEGREFGMFWSREEYLAERAKLPPVV